MKNGRIGVKSYVWLFYEKTEDSKTFKCKLCGQNMKVSHGATTDIRNHILRKHKGTSEANFLIKKSSEREISPVWLFYENTEDSERVKCKLCGQMLRTVDGSNSGIKNHILGVHRGTSEAEYLNKKTLEKEHGTDMLDVLDDAIIDEITELQNGTQFWRWNLQ